ncbi:hypothetical protein LTR85_001599 [Meristemomyces frigidus]|nr:hypothetical protein LTR85_001599 [Meristemomyces frigidus]
MRNSSDTHQTPTPQEGDTMPPLIEPEAEPPTAPPSAGAPDTIPDLAAMSQEDRDEYYQSIFAHVIPFEDIEQPDLCLLYPAYAEEIIDAYLQHMTFAFKVWINYDGAADKSFTDDRIQDCGEIRIPPKARKSLKEIGADKAQFRNVRFDIGTAFRPLAQLTIEVRPSKLKVGPYIDTFLADVATDRRHYELHSYLNALCDDIKDKDLTDGEDGFMLADVERLAGRFLFMPNEYEERKREWRSYDGDFVGAHGNTGYMEGIRTVA